MARSRAASNSSSTGMHGAGAGVAIPTLPLATTGVQSAGMQYTASTTAAALPPLAGVMVPAAGAVLPVPTAEQEAAVLSDPKVEAAVADVLTVIMPTAAGESKRQAVLSYIDSIIKKSIGAQVYPHGSYALKTYLPDSDIDVSAFFSRSHEVTWTSRVLNALCVDAHATSLAIKSVKSVTFVNAEVKIVKANINGINVDISGNQGGALAVLGLFEEVDRLVGRNHLFKRTLLLCRTWFQHEAGLMGTQNGLMSTFCLRTIILFIFNAFHTRIRTPLDGLYLLLTYLEHFQWNDHALSLFGPVRLASLPQLDYVMDGPCSYPGGQQLIPPALLQKYSTVNLTSGSSDVPAVFQPKFVNVIDPTNTVNNLGKSVHYKSVSFIQNTIVDGARRWRQVIAQLAADPAADTKAIIYRMFEKTFQAYPEINRRLEAQQYAAGLTSEPLSARSVSSNTGGGAGGLSMPALITASTSPARAGSGSPAMGLTATGPVFDPLDGNLARIVDNLHHAREFEPPGK